MKAPHVCIHFRHHLDLLKLLYLPSFSTLLMLNLETQQSFSVRMDVLGYILCYCYDGALQKL